MPTPLSILRPDPDNARQHDERNLSMIAESLGRFGPGRSILIDEDNTILAGNGVAEAATRAGIDQVRIVDAEAGALVAVRIRGLTDAQKRELAIADNRAGETSTWDLEALEAAMDDGAELDWLWSEEEFEALVAAQDDEEAGDGPGGPGAAEDPDETPDPPAEPITQPGDLWILGDHRLLCGDAGSDDDLDRLLGDRTPAMIFADPPYGMALDTNYSAIQRSPNSLRPGMTGKSYRPVAGDHEAFDPTPLLTRFRSTKEIFLWGADYYAELLPRGGWFVWDKCVTAEGTVSPGAEEMIGSNFELCWSKLGHKRRLVRIFHRGFASADSSERVHPTQKPIHLAEWFMSRYSKEGDLVLSPYLGSGTDLIAGERLQRAVYGLEIDPGYCDVIVQRWEAATGHTAHVDGKPHVIGKPHVTRDPNENADRD